MSAPARLQAMPSPSVNSASSARASPHSALQQHTVGGRGRARDACQSEVLDAHILDIEQLPCGLPHAASPHPRGWVHPHPPPTNLVCDGPRYEQLQQYRVRGCRKRAPCSCSGPPAPGRYRMSGKPAGQRATGRAQLRRAWMDWQRHPRDCWGPAPQRLGAAQRTRALPRHGRRPAAVKLKAEPAVKRGLGFELGRGAKVARRCRCTGARRRGQRREVGRRRRRRQWCCSMHRAWLLLLLLGMWCGWLHG